MQLDASRSMMTDRPKQPLPYSPRLTLLAACLTLSLLASGYFPTTLRAQEPGQLAVSKPTPEQLAQEKALQDLYPEYRGVDPDYLHAGPEALDRWMDRKFGMRIHWGMYAVNGLDATWPTLGASKEFQTIYRTQYQNFNPSSFDADEWAKLAEDAGFKYFVFTSKHHDGFSMFDTSTTVRAPKRFPEGKVPGLGRVQEVEIAYCIMDTPFKRDVVKELIDAMRAKGMGIGLYYSMTDWNDYNQRFEPYNYFYDPNYTLQSDPQGYRQALERQTTQLRELSTKYGRIDQYGFDHPGLPESLWHETVRMIKMVRRLQPQALFRHRGIGAYGDYMTPEHWVPPSGDDARLLKPWQAIEHFGTRWAWQPNDTYQSREWILSSLIDCCAKGGNFMVGISPMANGQFDQTTRESLLWVGRWLKVNGEAIYATRPWKWYREESNGVKFTRSKDEKYLYMLMEETWPGKQLVSEKVQVRTGTQIHMLGHHDALQYTQTQGRLVVQLPESLQDPAARPCEYAWVLRCEPLD